MTPEGLVVYSMWFMASISMIALVGWVDAITGPEIALSLFYIIPIIAIGWWLGTGATIVNALAAASCAFAADIYWHGESRLAISAWNGMTRLLIFMLLGLLFAALRRDRHRLQEIVNNESALARTDVLTGLPNRRAFIEYLGVEVARARRRGESICVACLDLDNFKKVNDGYGHLTGDGLLNDVARTILDTVRTSDFIGRIGGDEFAVVLSDPGVDDAAAIGQRLADRIIDLSGAYPGTHFGMSVGIALIDDPPEDVDAVLREADAALYEAKTRRDGQVVIRAIHATVGAVRAHPNETLQVLPSKGPG